MRRLAASIVALSTAAVPSAAVAQRGAELIVGSDSKSLEPAEPAEPSVGSDSESVEPSAGSGSESTGPTEPAPDDPLARSDALRKDAVAAFGAGDLQTALDKFKQAYEIDPAPEYLFNIGRVYEEMGQLEDALDYYERFSRQPRIKLEKRAKAAERIEVLRKLVGSREDKADDGPADETTDETKDETTDETTDETKGEVESSSEGSISAEPSTTEDKRPPADSRRLLGIGSSLLSGGAAIALGGGLGFGLAARNRSQRVSAVAPNNNPEGLTLGEIEDLDAEGRTFELYQLITVAAGGGLLVAGAILVGVGASRRAKRSDTSARLGPVVGPSLAGLCVQGRF